MTTYNLLIMVKDIPFLIFLIIHLILIIFLLYAAFGGGREEKSLDLTGKYTIKKERNSYKVTVEYIDPVDLKIKKRIATERDLVTLRIHQKLK